MMRDLSAIFPMLLHLLSTSSATDANQQKFARVVDPLAETERIVGGSIVIPENKYPYTAFFVSNGYKCGGTIINRNHVLTAGHCIKRRRPSSKTYVIVGHHRVKPIDAFGPDPAKVFGSNMIRVEKFIVRQDSKDIAILRLVRNIVFTDKAAAACLPGLPAQSYANMDAVVTGWGGTVGYDPGQPVRQKLSDVMRETTLSVVPPNTPLCTKAVGDQQSYLCAYRQGNDACQGDSGGPLTVKQNGKFVLIGVVSAGSGCGAQGYAGIYTRVSHFLKWIKQNVGQVCSPESSGSFQPDQTPQPTASPQLDGDCSCSSFINSGGFGQCKKSDPDFGGSASCYVNTPTTCTDLTRSQTNPEKFLSAEACRGKPPLDVEPTTRRPTAMVTMPSSSGCSCTDFVNPNGFGKCRKPDKDFGGSVSCYVKIPSTCNDLVTSGSNPDKSLSSQACRMTTTTTWPYKPTTTTTRRPYTPTTTRRPYKPPTYTTVRPQIPSSSGCSCSNFVNRNGFGRCQKADSDFGGSVSCYINNPYTSTCPDLVRSGSNSDKFLSSEACRTRSPHNVHGVNPTCSCSNFVNAHGFGRCRRRHVDFGDSAMCYVNLPSSCTDLVSSKSQSDKFLSSEACTYKADSSIQN